MDGRAGNFGVWILLPLENSLFWFLLAFFSSLISNYISAKNNDVAANQVRCIDYLAIGGKYRVSV